MAIFRAKTKEGILNEIKEYGAERPDKTKVKVADFSYESDDLAQLIVDAWCDPTVENRLLDKEQGRKLLAERGIYLSKPHVITESDYNKGHECDPDEIVLVLVNKDRITAAPPGRSLLETAKFLMAITPNGI